MTGDVLLDDAELMQAAYIGTRRHVDKLVNHQRDQYAAAHRNGDQWGMDIEAAAAELAFAKWANRFWSGARALRQSLADVDDIEVRHRSRRGRNSLIIRPADADERRFVLVLGDAPRFSIAGWFLAGDAKRQSRWLEDPNGDGRAWFVPADVLRPPSDLLAGRQTPW